MKWDLPTKVHAVVSDFDGVMTDNRVLVFSDGREAVIADRSDGLGISRSRIETALAFAGLVHRDGSRGQT